MKKVCMLLLAGVGLGAAAQAQQHISLGPTVGFGHSWISTGSDVATGYNKSAFHSAYNGGIKMVYSIQNHWGVSADVKFSSEGGTFENSADNKIAYRANYIRVPVQAIYFFGDFGDRIRPKVSLGPSVAFLVGGDTEWKVNDQKTEVGKARDQFDNFEAGVTGAVGANFRLASGVWLNTDIGYYHGLTNMNDVSSNNMKNRNVALNVGVLFGVGTGKGRK